MQSGKRPVLAGTDGSKTRDWSAYPDESRPYGDGWFQEAIDRADAAEVPSLRGRMVLPECALPISRLCPVPAGTDGSFNSCDPRGRDRPVPTGTDNFKKSSTAFS